MKKIALATSVIAAALVGSTLVPVGEEAAAKPRPEPLAWSPCPDNDPILGPMLQGLECGSLEVPLDYRKPRGRKITLELTRAKHTAPEDQYQGAVLLNRGQWPGGIGRDLPTRFAEGTFGLPADVSAAYDWIGFDPRGVGASEPAIVCDGDYTDPGHAKPDPVPSSPAAERELVERARAYAESCGEEHGDVLPYLTTRDAARDLDQIRMALGQRKISFFGTDWGTYLGSVYASKYPNRVRRMVLDSVVDPTGVWYRNNLAKNATSERNAKLFFEWVARYDDVYHLGTTAQEVEAHYYEGQDALRAEAIDGRIGPAEWADFFEPVVYRSWAWTSRAEVLADWVVRADADALRDNIWPRGYPHQNRQAMTNAVHCTDAPGPRGWSRWSRDYSRDYAAGNRFLTWTNAWYNAPCAFWPVAAERAPRVGHPRVNILLVQPELDNAHGLAGAVKTHKRFRNSRLIVERDGHSLGAALSANNNTCLDAYVSDYLRDGTRPASRWGTDATCEAAADPVPEEN